MVASLQHLFFSSALLQVLVFAYQGQHRLDKYSIEVNGTAVLIHINDGLHHEDRSLYHIYYTPHFGDPPPNTALKANAIGSVIKISNLHPATTYRFMLYYSNSTTHHHLIFSAPSINISPNPPTHLQVKAVNGTNALVTFSPPRAAGYSYIYLKVRELSDDKAAPEILHKKLRKETAYMLQSLTPGQSYLVHLSSFYREKESTHSEEAVFTSEPNPPSKFIVWGRNETTLQILVSPPLHSRYSHFKVSLQPEDAPQSVQYIKKEDQFKADFTHLVPGKNYNISVQTVSNKTLSVTISHKYKTLPLPPVKFQVKPGSMTSSRFSVSWEPPHEQTEFDKYKISIDMHDSNPVLPIILNKTEIRLVEFSKNLRPGRTYKVNATTVSGIISSREVSINATLCPLRVNDLDTKLLQNGHAKIKWRPNRISLQDSYEISYSEVQNGDSNSIVTNKTTYLLESLLPGRNYSISVKAVSRNVTSKPVLVFLATRPSIPNIEEMKMFEYGINISWKSDVNSIQDEYKIYLKNSSDYLIKNYTTKETHYLMQGLYPGEKYKVELYAVSHGLKSQPHAFSQVIYPKPPVNGIKRKIDGNSLTLAWRGPTGSLYSGFSIRYKTEEESKWRNQTVKEAEYEIRDLVAGERYLFEVYTVSQEVSSQTPLLLNHTLRPSPLADIAVQVKSTNITLEFSRPEGRIQYYVTQWISLDEGGKNNSKITEAKRNSTEEKTVSIVVDKLLPGATYEFHIHTESHGLHGNTKSFTRQTVPVILSQLKLEKNPEDRKSIVLEYTPTFQSDSHFDKYYFNLSDTGPILVKNVNETEKKVSFGNLLPGKLYTVMAWTVSGKLSSKPISIQERIVPDPVSQLIVTNVTDHSFTIKWDKPRCEVNSYEIQTFYRERLVSENITTTENFTVVNLTPFTNYSVKVRVVAGSESSLLRKSSPFSIFLQTNQGLPGMVVGFEPVNIRPREITFDWTLPPAEMNGNITKFTISCKREGSSDVRTVNISPTQRRTLIKELLPGKSYTFAIRAATTIGYGPPASFNQTMPIFAPPKPSSQAAPQEIFHTGTTIKIRYEKDYFSNENGQIRAFTIIVAEDDKKNTSGAEMPSWRDVQSYRYWPPYQVLEPYYPFSHSDTAEFVIGTEKSCQKSGYCNGPLKEGAVYRVKIRAFTTEKDFTDTDYSLPIQTDQNQVSLFVAFLLPAVFILFLIFGNMFLRKCRKKPLPSDSIPFEECFFHDESFTSKPVRVERFMEHYRSMSGNRNQMFSEEFAKLESVGRGQPCLAGNDYLNRSKNRFTNILPFDHSRVMLEPIAALPGSDYINASYIPGRNSVNEYIATQGPLYSTRDDFWRMCWETNSRAIVMLSRCVEEGREKCDHYWPEDKEILTSGSISIRTVHQQHHPDWRITQLSITRGNTERIVMHFHFISWPVFGVPNSPSVLVKFAKTFREKMQNEPRPIIVHCSAGVGRSGTFIAVDQIVQGLAKGEEYVDVYGLVYRMRKARMFMVQTEEQYITIHKCVLAMLQKPNDLYDRIYQNLAFEDDEGIAETGT